MTSEQNKSDMMDPFIECHLIYVLQPPIVLNTILTSGKHSNIYCFRIRPTVLVPLRMEAIPIDIILVIRMHPTVETLGNPPP